MSLVASDGRIDWWAFPTLESAPVCAHILDPERGGHFLLAPAEPYEVTRHYVPRTNVLRSTYRTASGSLEVTDSLNTGTGGPLPWTELARRIRGLEGRVSLSWEFVPGTSFTDSAPEITDRDGVPVVRAGGVQMAVISDAARPPDIEGTSVRGGFTVSEGEDVLVSIVASRGEPLFVPPTDTIKSRMERTVSSWSSWTELIDHDSPWSDQVVRSALTLKTLISEPADAIAAAATTSLPERVGGDKNWDYRFAWVRDSSFTVDALISLSLHEEVHAAVAWLLAAIERTHPDLRVFYTLSGEEQTDEAQTVDVPGYRASRPVRVGNDAARQTQLGNYGDLFDTIYRYAEAGHLVDPGTRKMLTELADRCAGDWTQEDSGIWELTECHHYTISKIGCWVALDRASRLARAGQLPVECAASWAGEAERVRAWVVENCWSETHDAYSFYAGSEELDAAVLLAGRTGFDRGDRLRKTIDAIEDELGVKGTPLIFRYSGMQDEEGTFVACTFWLVDALARTGQLVRARELMDRAMTMCNGLGLLSEEIDPSDGSFLGNFPQGLSHLSLINAADTLARASADND